MANATANTVTENTVTRVNMFEAMETVEALKITYFLLCKENQGETDLALLAEIDSQFDERYEQIKNVHLGKDGKIWTPSENSRRLRSKESAESFRELVFTCFMLENCIAEFDGGWLWVYGDTKSEKETLKLMGFWYSANRQGWYYKGY